jgi:hypothetical protein
VALVTEAVLAVASAVAVMVAATAVAMATKPANTSS